MNLLQIGAMLTSLTNTIFGQLAPGSKLVTAIVSNVEAAFAIADQTNSREEDIAKITKAVHDQYAYWDEKHKLPDAIDSIGQGMIIGVVVTVVYDTLSRMLSKPAPTVAQEVPVAQAPAPSSDFFSVQSVETGEGQEQTQLEKELAPTPVDHFADPEEKVTEPSPKAKANKASK